MRRYPYGPIKEVLLLLIIINIAFTPHIPALDCLYFITENDTHSNEDIVKIMFTYDEKDGNEWDNNKIEAEWGEPVKFISLQMENEKNESSYIWIFKNVNSGENYTAEGKIVNISFYPSTEDLIYTLCEKFLITLVVLDDNSELINISYSFELWVYPDDDNDNDGMPDNREVYFWSNLSQEPVDDYDHDNKTNIEEIGFHIPQFESEKKNPYSIDRRKMDPVEPEVIFDLPNINVNDPEEKGLSTFILIIIIIFVFLIILLVGIITVKKLSCNKKKNESNTTVSTAI